MARLPPHLHSVRATILASPSTPSLSDVCSMILRVTPPPEVVPPSLPALLSTPTMPPHYGTRGGRRGGRRSDSSRPPRTSSRLCSHCGRSGHTEATCFKKHGYPTGYQPHASPAVDNTPSSRSDVDMLREELQQLRGLLTRPPSSVASTSAEGTACSFMGPVWIVDSGATHHISPMRPRQLSSISSPTSIIVANGASTPVHGVGDVDLSPSIVLRDVLHVPASKFHLLSVSKLTTDLDCSLTFTPTTFVMQDRRTRNIIGRGCISQGLYTLDSPPTALSSTSTTTIDWHRRLGHAPLPILRRALP